MWKGKSREASSGYSKMFREWRQSPMTGYIEARTRIVGKISDNSLVANLFSGHWEMRSPPSISRLYYQLFFLYYSIYIPSSFFLQRWWKCAAQISCFWVGWDNDKFFFSKWNQSSLMKFLSIVTVWQRIYLVKFVSLKMGSTNSMCFTGLVTFLDREVRLVSKC